MITVADVSITNNFIYEFRGLSTDTKPSDTNRVGNGATYIEIDTGKVFMFDQENVIWKEI